MIVCNKCGVHNPDEAVRCERCGHKLQSVRGTHSDDDHERPVELGPIVPPPNMREVIRKHVEAWAYVGALASVAAYSLTVEDYTPLWVATGILALVAWLRRI